jgi:AraC-like DNA-binding protein
VALDGELLFEWTGEWHPYRLAVIPSRLRHAMDAQGRLGAQIFVEPESPAGRILIENFCGDRRIGSADFDLVASSAHRLLSNFLAGADADLLVDDARAVISDLTSGSQPRNVTDPRILTAIELMTRKLDMNLTLRHVASLVHLSPGRFRHLFVEETGTPLRPYILWLRMATAVDAMSRGESITTAAHLAGFSDSAHLSRIFRRTFGMAPSALRFDETPKRKHSMIVPQGVQRESLESRS